jgi:NADH-quinone oxidoreductase subunit J
MVPVDVVFYVLAAIAVVAAVGVVTAKNPVHSVLLLVLTFVGCAGTWIIAEAEFLGIALVLVYVGAVMVLFLFVVMMLDINIDRLREGFMRQLPVGIVVAVGMLTVMLLVVGAEDFNSVTKASEVASSMPNAKLLGYAMYSAYVYPFEIAAVILLVAIVVAISLTLRRRPETKYQNPSSQVRVRREDRITLAKVAPEKAE